MKATLDSAAAVAYDRIGTGEAPEVYKKNAEEVFVDEYTALKKIAEENEPIRQNSSGSADVNSEIVIR